MARQLWILAGVVLLLVVLVAGALIAYSNSLPHSGKNSMSLKAFSLCQGNCIYASPYLSGNVLVNATVPLVSLQLTINGTNEFWANYLNYGIGNYTIPYRVSPYNQSLPIVAGKSYLVTLVATFIDNTTLSASTLVVAAS
jgi:hypothetical protein